MICLTGLDDKAGLYNMIRKQMLELVFYICTTHCFMSCSHQGQELAPMEKSSFSKLWEFISYDSETVFL